MLICGAGERELVRYIDGVAFDCKPLPEPEECATTASLRLCGDTCGPCDAGDYCTARSPLHPYGFCAPLHRDRCFAGLPCPGSETCFFYDSTPDAQAFADSRGICLAQALCQAAATELPGGGRCEETAE